MSLRYMLPSLILTTCALGLSAADPVDAVIAELEGTRSAAAASYEQEVTQLAAIRDAAIAAGEARAIRDLERAVKRAARSGDLSVAAKGWKAVLGMDQQHREARQFFEAIGQLDAVLAEVSGTGSVADAPITVDLVYADAQPEGARSQPLSPQMQRLFEHMRRQQVEAIEHDGCCTVQQLDLGSPINHEARNPVASLPSELRGLRSLSMVDGHPIFANFRAGQQVSFVVAVVAEPGHRTRDLLEREGWQDLPEVTIGAEGHGEQPEHQLRAYVKRFEGADIQLRTEGWCAFLY